MSVSERHDDNADRRASLAGAVLRVARAGPRVSALFAVALGLTGCPSFHRATPTPFVPATLVTVGSPDQVGLPSGSPVVVPIQLDESGRLRGTSRRVSGIERQTDAAERSRQQTQRDDQRQKQVAQVTQRVRQFGELRYLESERVESRTPCPGGVAGEPVRHRFFSYARNLAVDVLMCQDSVVSIQEQPGASPAASAEEERDAINTARNDPRLAAQVAELEADAILTTTCRGPLIPYRCPHRTMYVTFSASGEEGTRYEAEVDLAERRVLRASPTRGAQEAPAASLGPAQRAQAQRRQAQRDASAARTRHELIEGDVAWKGWQFHYRLESGARTGLQISDVVYDGRPVVQKMSLPVIRVRYARDTVWYKPWTWFPFDRLLSQGCGPFNDRIDASNVEVPAGADAPVTPWPRDPEACPGKVCRREWPQGEAEWLEYGAYARIGKYHIYHAWYFSAAAGAASKVPPQIHAAVWSGGIACDMEHVHHPYWRFDFGPADGAADQVYLLQPGTRAWSHYTTEGDWRKDSGSSEPNAQWFVRQRDRPDGVWVIRGSADGASDGFANRDVSVRAYQGAEDGNWDLDEFQDLPYANGESVATAKAVVWYVGHMSHAVADETQQGWKWHHAGPYLVVHPPPR